MASRELDEQSALNGRQCTRHHNQTAIARTSECRDGLLDLASLAHVDRAYLHPERRRHGLDDGELAYSVGYGRVP